jgi:hypothetical protein
LSDFKKQPKHKIIRPYFIRSTNKRGVYEEHLQPNIFSSEEEDQIPGSKTLLEIVRDYDISDVDSANAVTFARNAIGKPFPNTIRWEALTHAIGLPNIFRNPDEYACHWLVYDALASIGVYFPHNLEYAPFFNIAKLIGHPLGHPKDRVDPSRPYLRDHHLYRDPRFVPILSIEANATNPIVTINPGKYSWSPHLQEVYRINRNP